MSTVNPAGGTLKEQVAAEELTALLAAEPALEWIEVFCVDLNGILRGKRIAREDFAKLWTAGVNLPAGSALLDCKGATIDGLDMGTRDGDPDVICRPVHGSLSLVPWAVRPTAQVLLDMRGADGGPWFGDPRHVLERALQPLKAMDLHPVVAVELEFYLIEEGPDGLPRPRMAPIPGTRLLQDGPQYGSLDDLGALDGLLAEVAAACRLQNLPASTAVAEFAPGQYELNLHHVDDPMLACDHAVLLKRLVKGIAARHGLGATFMAKPFRDSAGNGLHVHASLLDGQGRNVFAAPAGMGETVVSASLRHAVGGLAALTAESMAIFAPTANSYRRLRPGTYVPLTPNWGYNHRAVAFRIPLSGPRDLRIEHRVAGADANPYLVMAAVMAGLHHGLETRAQPGEPVAAGAVLEPAPTLPLHWEAALDRFENASVLPRYLGSEFCRVYAACRRVECERFHAEVGEQDYRWYLRAV